MNILSPWLCGAVVGPGNFLLAVAEWCSAGAWESGKGGKHAFAAWHCGGAW